MSNGRLTGCAGAGGVPDSTINRVLQACGDRASPVYRLRRCDEEYGSIPYSESIGLPVLGRTKKNR